MVARVQSVGELVRNKLQGNVPTAFTDGDRKIDLRVRLVEHDRETVEQLRGLIVNADSSVPLRLSDVAEIDISDGPAEIRRIGHQRAGVISANLAGMDLGQVVDEVHLAERREQQSVLEQEGHARVVDVAHERRERGEDREVP